MKKLKEMRKFLTNKYVILGVVLLGAVAWGYFRFVAPTRVAFVNFPDFLYIDVVEADTNPFIRVTRHSFREDGVPQCPITGRTRPGEGKAPNLSKYRAVFIFGMGLEINEAQRRQIERAMAGGTKVYVTAATSDENRITNLSPQELTFIEGYFGNRGKKNMRRLLNYTRRVFDRKVLFSEKVEEPLIVPANVFFHLLEEGEYFTSYAEYQAFLEERGYYREGAPRVILFTFIAHRASTVKMIIQDLEVRGFNVYPVVGFAQRLEFIRAVDPDLAILMPHGRLSPERSEEAVRLLKEKNIPLLCPLSVFAPYEEWVRCQKGMTGGMLSQSIVMPELDGGIAPFVVSAQFKGRHGLYVPQGIPERIKIFGNKVENWLNLQTMPNSEKRVVIFYYKGPGLNAMVAGGMEVAPSLLNLLRHLKKEGYHTGPLPANEEELLERIQREGSGFGVFAQGAIREFIEKGYPALIPTETYLEWLSQDLRPGMVEAIKSQYGPPAEAHMFVEKEGRGYLALARIQFGNIVILPQPLPGYGDDESQLIHGAKKAPPHIYVAAYLWARNEFNADALMHFGTHGSLEFTPWKGVALSQYDWPDALVGDLPHVYIYTIENIGEAMIAKRRSYAVIISHLTPPFAGAGLSDELSDLHRMLHDYEVVDNEMLRDKYRQSIRKLILESKMHLDLGFENLEEGELTAEMITEIHNHIHALSEAKITLGLYTLGERYKEEHIYETVRQMAIDPIAFSKARLDLLDGKITEEQLDDACFFDEHYRQKAFRIIDSILRAGISPLDFLVGTEEEWKKLEEKEAAGTPLSAEESDRLGAIRDYRNTILSIKDYFQGLKDSPFLELAAATNALSGGFILPSSGGDAIFNPQAIPTGRNLYSIDPERMPTPESWEVGVHLSRLLMEARLKETGEHLRKVAFTLWAGEFIRDHGATLAQIFYFLGVEPVRDSRGIVQDLRLIPPEELGRPRVDVVVQTSGQFRDIAASRVFLINRAVVLASQCPGIDEHKNYVREGTLAAERLMIEQGLSPLEARLFATARVFGAVDGSYGTGIMGLVESGDKWEDEKEIAQQYIRNMGAIYTESHWGHFQPGILEAALQGTEAVVHPRSSNVHGPLSLDHVYEFMGGLISSIRYVTGEDPAAYFSDLRNPRRPVVQGLKEAIWTEARTTLLNPKYIQALQEGGASSAEVFAETFRNTYGWNVMKPAAIDDELWEKLHHVYIRDTLNLGIREFFVDRNPFALQEMTAVMLETIRKELWDADEQIIRELVDLHARLVKEHQAGCSVFVCDNQKLREMIQGLIDDPELRKAYLEQIELVRVGEIEEGREAIKLEKVEKETVTLAKVKEMLEDNPAAVITLLVLVILFSAVVVWGVIKRRKISPGY
jgi:cobaltochelatase CobN